LPADKMRD